MTPRLRKLAGASALCLLLAACTPDPVERVEPEPEPEPVEEQEEGEPTPPPNPFRSSPEQVAGGLEIPWDIDFAGEEEIFLTERPGRVRVVRDGRLIDEPVAEIDVAATGEAGLLGIALHPEFDDEPFLYLYYTGHRPENRVSRFRLREGGPAGYRLGDEEVLVDGIPAASVHDGGRIAFGPDGMLYVTTGDAGNPSLSAARDSLAGKILRLTPEGEVPGDNPFGGNPVWAYGLRNPQGIAWDEDDNLYASDHGPSGEYGLCCHDELNLISPGGFYGWPLRAGERDAAPAGEVAVDDDPIDPIAESGPANTWAPSGIAFVPGGRRGSVAMANLRGEHVRRFVIGDDPSRVRDQRIPVEGVGRLRTAAVGPDECLYLLTSNRDGRGSPREEDDRVLRLCP